MYVLQETFRPGDASSVSDVTCFYCCSYRDHGAQQTTAPPGVSVSTPELSILPTPAANPNAKRISFDSDSKLSSRMS